MLESWPGWLRGCVFSVTGVTWANNFAQSCSNDSHSQHEMLRLLFERRKVKVTISGSEKLEGLGACIIAGNHPHGLWDGIALAMLASRQRPTRVVARDFLNVFTPLRSTFLTVSLNKNRRLKTRQSPVEPALQVLAQGDRVVITPAGGLSIAKPFWQQAKDPQWRTGIVRLLQGSQQPLVLVKIDAGRSPLRQMLHSIHPIVRSVAQIWAFRLKLVKPLHLQILEVVHASDLPFDNMQANAQWLQAKIEG